MKEEFKGEVELSKMLDLDKVDVPRQKLNQRLSLYQRFIRYLASPTKDPLERVTTSSAGFFSFNTLPIACGLLLAFLQIILSN